MISFTDILITPKRFFRELCKKESDLKFPALIVLATAIISAISAYFVTGKTMGLMPEGMENAIVIIELLGAAAALVMTFIIWVIWAAAILVMVYLLKGEPSFTRLLEVTGYGFIPQLIGTVISTGIMITMLPDLVIRSTSNVAEMEAAINAYMASPPMMAAMFIGLIFTIWSAYIWIFGVSEVSKLELKNAAICVGVPMAIYILITFGSLFM